MHPRNEVMHHLLQLQASQVRAGASPETDVERDVITRVGPLG